MKRSSIFTASRSRKPRGARRLALEGLERREMMSSTGVVPEKISIPLGSATFIPRLDSAYHAEGTSAITANELDYYRFQAPEKGIYQVSATTPASDMDTVLGVFDVKGNRLGYNDDINGSLNRDSRTFVLLDRGAEYVFAVTNYTGKPGGSYTWDVRRTDDSYDAFGGDTKATAINLGGLNTRRVQAGLVLADGSDWFQFYLPAAPSQGKVEIRFEHDLGDLDMALYNASGQQIGWSQGTGDKETLSLVGQPINQYYYVHVYGHSGAANPFYTLDVNPWNTGFQIDVTSTGFNATQQAMIRQAADQWEQIITGDLPSASFNGKTIDDLSITVAATSIDGQGKILGFANWDLVRPNNGLPYLGHVNMDSSDVAKMVTGGDFLGTVVHEMGHVLGIGTYWTELKLLSGASTTNPRFTGKQATAAYNQIFNRNDTGVPVEATGGSGTALCHWRESELTVEMMTGWNNAGFEPISRITVGSLADMGYAVKLAAAEYFTPPPTVPTGSAWYGNITVWNPASVAVPADAAPSQFAASLDPAGGQSLVSWNVLGSSADQPGPFDSKYALAWLPGLNVEVSSGNVAKTSLTYGPLDAEDVAASAAMLSALDARTTQPAAARHYAGRKSELCAASIEPLAMAADYHLRRLEPANNSEPLARLVGDLDLSWVAASLA